MADILSQLFLFLLQIHQPSQKGMWALHQQITEMPSPVILAYGNPPLPLKFQLTLDAHPRSLLSDIASATSQLYESFS